MIGQTLGHYRIQEKLGEGGMGVVYLAEDTQLGRRVAIKLLPEEYAAQEDRLQRFLSEAKLASSINHPNIVSIYELGEHAGRRFIAMEYVPGQSLRASLQKRGLTLKRLLALALPVAEALARAHRAGIIHRDIKPENLLVSEDGYIKVADFGLAKLKPTPSAEATVTGQVATDAGKVVGTVAYMSPEQLQGHEVDARSDIFSFGAVLYEMATGRSPFLRDSAASTSAAILRDDPRPVRTLAGSLPVEAENLVNKALEKDPAFRYQAMDELAADLRRLRRDLESGRLAEPAAAAPVAASRWSRTGLWAGGAVLLATVILLGALLWRGRPATAPATSGRVMQLTALPGLEDSPTWSPDGRSLAYVSDAAGNLDIYVQQTDGGRAIKLTDSDADDAQPAWSPDGSRIAFVSVRARPEKRLAALLNMGIWTLFLAGRNGDVWVMPALGGAARRVAEDAYYPSWSPDGKKLVYQALRNDEWDLAIQEVDAGGEPRALGLTRLQTSVVTQPAWSPDGKWVAFVAGEPGDLRVYVVSVDGGEPRGVSEPHRVALAPSWSPDGRWLYFSSDHAGQMNLWKARLENGRTGELVQVTSGSRADLYARPDPSGKRLAYSSLSYTADLWEHDLKSSRALRATAETTLEDSARLSPDGKWLAFGSNRLGSNHLWVLNRENGSLTQVTTTAQPEVGIASHWSWEGKSLFYSTSEAIWQYETATGSSRKVYAHPGGVRITGGSRFCLSPGDKYLVLAEGAKPSAIVRVELASGKKEVVAQIAEGLAGDPSCSADGQWVTFHVHRGNLRTVWVAPLAGGAPRQLSRGDSEDSHPVWGADSQSIYFDRNHQDVYVVPLGGGAPRPVTNYRSFSISLDYPSVSADGRKLFFTRNDKAGDIYLLETPAE